MFMIDLGVESHYSFLGIAPEASPGEIRKAKHKLAGDLERQRQQARTPDEKRSLEEQMTRINSVGDMLSNPEHRAKYDTQNAHLTFFVVRKVAAPAMEDREIRLRWLHQAVREFLTKKGDNLDPLSDLERSDFTSDYTPNELLEQILRHRR